MQVLREKTKDKFEKMREKASKTIKSKTANQVKMGPIKSLGEL